MEFVKFRNLIADRFASISRGSMFKANCDLDTLWNLYLDSFPIGTNEVYRERREYDCSACRHFVKRLGNVVAIENGEVKTIWDVETNDFTFQPVANALAKYVRQCEIFSVFLTNERRVGVAETYEKTNFGVQAWQHFYADIPTHLRVSPLHVDTKIADANTTVQVFKRSLMTISLESVDTVLELIASNSLYRAEEWKSSLVKFRQYLKDFQNASCKDLFVWENAAQAGTVIGRIRNHSIGTLLVDISDGVDLETAVRKYEGIMAPANYKRPKTIFTKKMLEDAKRKVEELGYLSSLPRRFARLSDISVNNILFANRNVRPVMKDVFGELEQEVAVNPKRFSRVEEIPIGKFVADVLPTAKEIGILLENRHSKNLVSLITAKNEEAPSMFKWGNPFSWAYAGNIADSDIRENVKSAGGKVDGVLRFSIQWNDEDQDLSDLDAHCKLPGIGEIAYYSRWDYNSLGELDVDIRWPTNGKPAVENITWPNISRLPHGDYRFYVHCYANRGNKNGFRAEIAFGDEIYSFDYHKPMRQDERVYVAVVHFDGHKFSMTEKIPSANTPKEVWSLTTGQFIPVSTIMYSPNYWDEQEGTGNKHYFFMLNGCVNPDRPNGFFNEYLKNELLPHKRVFEALGSKMAVEDDPEQLSGLGFSSTQRNDMIVKVKGATERTLRIKF